MAIQNLHQDFTGVLSQLWGRLLLGLQVRGQHRRTATLHFVEERSQDTAECDPLAREQTASINSLSSCGKMNVPNRQLAGNSFPFAHDSLLSPYIKLNNEKRKKLTPLPAWLAKIRHPDSR